MSLTGLFLITFLVVHLIGNLQLIADDGGQSFNEYAHFMTTNPLIKTVSYGLYFFILLHIYMGIRLWAQNRAARGNKGYKVKVTRSKQDSATTASNMMWLGMIIAIFLAIHLYQFWFKMKMGQVDPVAYGGDAIDNLYLLVSTAYASPIYVWFYVISMLFIGWHLWHGFHSAFQTLGLEHEKYTPLIKAVGKIYSVLIPALFALIPLQMYYGILDAIL
jgi:succinate dehydrogenase / fumarate reductase cytochrome b subunit